MEEVPGIDESQSKHSNGRAGKDCVWNSQRQDGLLLLGAWILRRISFLGECGSEFCAIFYVKEIRWEGVEDKGVLCDQHFSSFCGFFLVATVLTFQNLYGMGIGL